MYNLYIIKNTVNSKVYIGQTKKSIESRFKEHLKDAYLHPNRKLYAEVIHLGCDVFYVELLKDNVEDSEVDRLEAQYIAEFDSFYNGLNSTKGGEGRRDHKLDSSLIESLFIQGYKIQQIADKLYAAPRTIRQELIILGYETNKPGKPVIWIDKNLKFDSLVNCARYLISHGHITSSERAATAGISRVVSGRRKTYNKMLFCGVA